jgi:hypothetical protein
MTIDEVLNHFKSEYRVCQLLGIGRQNFTYWKKKGYITYMQQLELEKLSEGELKANIQDLYDRYSNHSVKTKQGLNKRKEVAND